MIITTHNHISVALLLPLGEELPELREELPLVLPRGLRDN